MPGMPLLLIVLLIALYAPNAEKLFRHAWPLVDYSHAPFILPVSLWLAWRKRAEIKRALGAGENSPALWSLPVLVLGLLLFLFGWRQDYLSVTTFSLIPILFGLTGFVYGTAIVKLVWFPILYLAFLVPPPIGMLDSATLPMRHIASVGAEFVLKLLHYPITRQGLLLSVGGHDLFLGQPCSGFHSLITMLALGTAYVHLTRTSRLRGAILVTAIIPFALIGNISRIVVLCLITVHFGKEAGEGFFHNFSGLVVFVVMILCLIFLNHRLSR